MEKNCLICYQLCNSTGLPVKLKNQRKFYQQKLINLISSLYDLQLTEDLQQIFKNHSSICRVCFGKLLRAVKLHEEMNKIQLQLDEVRGEIDQFILNSHGQIDRVDESQYYTNLIRHHLIENINKRMVVDPVTTSFQIDNVIGNYDTDDTFGKVFQHEITPEFQASGTSAIVSREEPDTDFDECQENSFCNPGCTCIFCTTNDPPDKCTGGQVQASIFEDQVSTVEELGEELDLSDDGDKGDDEGQKNSEEETKRQKEVKFYQTEITRLTPYSKGFIKLMKNRLANRQFRKYKKYVNKRIKEKSRVDNDWKPQDQLGDEVEIVQIQDFGRINLSPQEISTMTSECLNNRPILILEKIPSSLVQNTTTINISHKDVKGLIKRELGFLRARRIERRSKLRFEPLSVNKCPIKTVKYVVCKFCAKDKLTIVSIRAHMLKEHPTENEKVIALEKKKSKITFYECPTLTCAKKFFQKRAYERHILNHTSSPVQFQCDQCGKIFLKKENLFNHKRSKHEDPQFICSEPNCGGTFFSKAGLQAHQLRIHRPVQEDEKYFCDQCSKSFILDHDLRRHLLKHGIGGKFNCEVVHCKKSFQSLAKFQEHQKWHVGTRDLKCFICPDKAFVTQKRLREHMKDWHPPDGSNICPFCQKVLNKNYLEPHINQVHKKIFNFTCEICAKKFFRQTELKTHLNWHAREKKIACELCDKKFAYPSELVTHMKSAHQAH